MRISLDTNAYSRLMKGHGGLTECIEDAEEVFLSATVLGELYAGFHRGSRPEKNTDELMSFLSLPGVEVVDITQDIADRYGRLVKGLLEAGRPLPTNDIWIAAAALETGSRLVTYDKHFNEIAGLLTLAP